jgi:hypothetical protein
MNPVETPCLLGQCFRPRLLACLANASGQDSLLDLGLLEYPYLQPVLSAPPWPLHPARPSPRPCPPLRPATLVGPEIVSETVSSCWAWLLVYLSSPIHGIASWPAAIITTIAPSAPVWSCYPMMFRKLFKSWIICHGLPINKIASTWIILQFMLGLREYPSVTSRPSNLTWVSFLRVRPKAVWRTSKYPVALKSAFYFISKSNCKIMRCG